MTPALVAVAGCLFEVHLDGDWAWTGVGEGVVTLIAAHPGRLRFRAEREGEATLTFTAAGGRTASLPIRIAPEDET